MTNPLTRILITDDDALTLKATSRLLTSAGYEALTAINGEQTLQMVAEHHPDLLLLDVVLPDIEGTEICRRLKADASTADIFIILLSGIRTSSDEQAQGMEDGADGYITRPIANRELLARIQAYIRVKAAEQKLSEYARKLEEEIAERKQAEEELKQSEARLAEAQAVARVGSWEADLSNLQLMWSEETYRIFEIDPQSFHPTHPGFLSFIHPEDRAKVDAAFFGSFDTRESNAIEHRIITPGGIEKIIEERWQIFRDDQGQPARAVGTCQDITARKQAEEKLLDSELRFRRLFEAAKDGILILDAETGAVLDVNPFLIELLGYSHDVFLGKEIWELGFFKDIAENKANFLELQQKEYIRYEDLPLKTAYGQTVHVEFVSNVYQVNHQKVIQCNIRDITERTRAEEQLRFLYEASQRLNRTLNMNEIYQAICDFMLIVAPNDGLVISAFDPQTKLITCRAYWMENKWMDVSSFPPIPLEEEGKGTQSIAIRTGQAMLVNDYQARVKTAQTAYYVNEGEVVTEVSPDEDVTRSALIVPLKIGGKVNGVIQVMSYRLNAYTEDQLKLLEALALHIASAEQNSLLYTQAQTELNERIKTEFFLRSSEENLNKAQKYAHLGSWTWNIKTNQLNWSDEMYRIFGIKPEEFTGNLAEVIARAIHPADREKVENSNRSVVEHGKPLPLEYRIVWLNGATRVVWAEAGEMILDEEGNPAFLSGIVQDITERKQAEDEIRHRITELETLYESGLALSQLLSPKEIAQKIIELLERKMDWHHIVIRLFNPQNKNWELLAFSQPSLKDEKQQREAEARFNNRIFEIGQGLVGWVIQNSQIVRSGDVSNDPRYLETFQDIHSGMYVPIKLNQGAIGVISIESREPNAFSEADERLVATLTNQAAVALENASLFQTAQQEIAEREKVEALLADERNQLARRVEERTSDLSRVNSDLARALRSRDEFLASMSHELRTPLTGILGFSETLQLKTYGELSEKQLRAVKIIEESGRHLLDLINDILDLSKIEAGKVELLFMPCSLADICQASLQLTKGMAQHKHQNLIYTPATEPVSLHADSRRIKQILVNLLGNAIKFTPENGELGLEVQADAAGRNVKLTVWDKGIGIKTEDMRKLFKPFTQIDSSLAREYSGTGLGLSLVQRLTELHGGSIQVESVIGEGSRFTVILPWSPQNAAPYAPRRNTGKLSSSAGSPERESALVMIADDNEIVLQMMADFLEEQYRVVKVRSGAELLERAAELHPDVMLVDIQMPVMDGLETMRRIRAHADPAVAATPLIAVTALAMPGDREICLRAGANEYASKPMNLNALAAMIRKYTGT